MGVKISDLPQATTSQNDDIFPIVQNGVTKQVSKELIVEEVNNKCIISPTEPEIDYGVWFAKGKNLANNILTTQTVSDVTITKNNDGTLTLNGTATATFTKTIAIVNLKGGKTYTLSGGEGLTRETVSLDMRVSEAGNLYGGNWYIPVLPTVTIANDITLYLTIRIQSGATFTNKVISPMLEEGSTATTYEAYVTPSINVDDVEIYSKPNYASYQGTTTSSQTISGTTATTINNLSLNIYTTGKPLCIATGFLAKTANASYSAKVKIYIDGVEKVDRFGTIISTNDMYYPLMIILNNIEAGSHTIEIKVAGENTNSSITFATWYTRYLNAWELM